MQRIEIVPYDFRWPEIFQKHAAIVRQALDGIALQVEHVGSTAVPGLSAKPVVDILLVVRDSSDESAFLTKLESAGYELVIREPEFHQHRMFRTRERDVHLHVFSQGSAEVVRMLNFRDRLRENAADRSRYEDTKRKLAGRLWPDLDAYARAKGDVVESIIAAANQGLDR